MKANEFVKKFGWEKSKMAVKKLLPMEDGMPVFDYNSEDLKRLVESHELVMCCGGLEDARSHLESIRFNIATKTWFGRALLNWSMYADKLEKAIFDVESCL